VLLLLTAWGCSSSTTVPTPVTTASTFAMTWPTLAFASTAVGTTAATPVVITLSNYGTSAVAVSSVNDDNPGEFPYTTTCSVGGTLAPQSVCQVTARFKPATTGARTATVTVSANNATQTFDLSGTGVTPATPHVTIDLTTGPPSTIFTLSVTGATPSGTLTFNTIYTASQGSPGVLTTTSGWAADGSGNATIASNSDERGTYESWVVDATTGVASNHVTHTVQ
jgi:hypothetical protein